MAKQRRQSSKNSRQQPSSRRRTPTTRSSSTVQTNSFVKGMNKDIAPSLENNQSWWHARNLVNNSEDGDLGVVGNEPSNLLCGVIPYTVIGAIHRYGDEWIVYSTDDINSEIGRFDDSECKYTVLINDPCLSFSRKHLITGAAKENFDCTWQVYWDDGNNPSRSLNVDDIPYKQVQISGPGIDGNSCAVYEDIEPKELDCEKIRLAPLLDTPCVKLEKSTDGGQLRNGAYQAYIAYVQNEQKVTDYIGVSNIQTIWADDGSAGSLNISVSNLDEDYEYFELVILRRNQGQTSAKRIGFYSTQTNNINLDFIDPALTAVSLKNIPLRTPAYEKSESMFVVNDYLIRQGPVEQFDFNYQPLANNIKVQWVTNAVPSNYYSNGGNKFNFMRDEQYAFFIRWIYNTGERSSSYHIPGRAPRNYNANGNILLENELIFGENVLDINGDKLFKVYNTASLTSTLNIDQEDGSIITAKGDMGYWESTERYPTNRPDIWGNLCGKFIRHHKMPTEQIASQLHLTDTNGDLINILGVQFENIERPKFNDGTYIENIVGYEILRGSRLGAKSILGKGIFRNMRKYTIPNGDNLIGQSTQGLYPNYPYNDLRPDIYFHEGGKNSLNRTDGCDTLGQSLTTFRALGDRPDVNGEPSGYSRKAFTFHSPDLMFTKPFLNAYETRLYGQLSGSSTGYFKPSEEHPQFKLLRGSAGLVASILGFGYALHQIRGTRKDDRQGMTADSAGLGGEGGFIVGGFTNGGGIFTSPGLGTTATISAFQLGAIAANTLTDIATALVIDTAGTVDDVYTGGAVFDIINDVKLKTDQALGAIPGVVGGRLTLGTDKDTSTSNLPLFARLITSLVLTQSNIAIGGNEIIELMYNLVKDSDFAWKYNSLGFYSNYSNQVNGLWRIKNTDSNYVGSSFQLFDGGNYKINNLFRPETVVVALDKQVSDPTIKDKSRFVVGGEMELFQNAQGEYTQTVVAPFSDSYLLDPRAGKQSPISSYYGALKFNFDNQYGQLSGIKQVQMRGCVELIDPTKPNEFLYTSKPIFSGDTFVGRFTEKTIMPIFTDYLMGQPDGFTYNYSLYANIPYPRFWLNSQKFDMSVLASEIATFGFASTSEVDNKYPGDLYYLDRGNDSCSTNWDQIFGGGSDPNPAFAMEYAYMYTHSNGILDFFVESEINLTQREYEDLPGRQIYSSYSNNDIDELFHAKIEKAGNFYKYDESLSPSKFPSQLGSFAEVQPLDYDPLVAETCFVSYPKRLIYSLQAQEEARKDYWRVFLNFNYKDFKNEVSVIKPVNQNGAVVFFPNLSPSLFNGVDTLKTQLDTKITIGDGGLFSQPMQNIANADISMEYGSCESIRGVINTAAGLFYISQAQGKIFQYVPGRGLSPISNAGMKWWFAKYLPSRFVKQFPDSEESVWSDNPVKGVGCQVMYDAVDDVVYFMKRDFGIKPEYITVATFTNSLVKPVRLALPTGTINVDIGDPLFFDDCSWTCSYDPKTQAWLSFHDWHPEISLPSINHFFTTKTIESAEPICPPGYNYNSTSGLCERATNITEPADIIVENIASNTSGGSQSCLVDLVIAIDTSGSTNGPPTQDGAQTRANAEMGWLNSFLSNSTVTTALDNNLMQIGFVSWSGQTVNGVCVPGNANTCQSSRLWNSTATSCATGQIQGTPSPVSMSSNSNTIQTQADNFFTSNWINAQTCTDNALHRAQDLLNDRANSQLGDRTGQANFRKIILLVTDATVGAATGCAYQSPLAATNGTAPNDQFVYALFCGVNSPFPGGTPLNTTLNTITCTPGPVTANQGPGVVTDPFQYGIQSSIDANYPITNWDIVANGIAADICGTPTTCECPTGYTLVYRDPVTNSYINSTGDCDPANPPICRKVTCSCPPNTVPGSVVTPIGTCPDTAPQIYQMVDADAPQADPRLCNYYLEETTEASKETGSIWRHNFRCDSFVNFYNKNYPWEIDIISNTGQTVNTVRSFEYQLESYVYKGDPQFYMCGGDKWEDLDFNFDSSIVYNSDQVSGQLILNTQPSENPWGELAYPIITPNSIEILSSKVEHKFRFNQFWDITNDRGEFTNVEQSIFNTECNGYIRPLNSVNLNYNKPNTQRKKFRHYSNQVILRRNVSGDRKMLLRLDNTKLLLSKR